MILFLEKKIKEHSFRLGGTVIAETEGGIGNLPLGNTLNTYTVQVLYSYRQRENTLSCEVIIIIF